MTEHTDTVADEHLDGPAMRRLAADFADHVRGHYRRDHPSGERDGRVADAVTTAYRYATGRASLADVQHAANAAQAAADDLRYAVDVDAARYAAQAAAWACYTGNGPDVAYLAMTNARSAALAAVRAAEEQWQERVFLAAVRAAEEQWQERVVLAAVIRATAATDSPPG